MRRLVAGVSVRQCDAMDARTTAAHDGAHLRAILRLGAPLVVNNVAYSGMLFADTVMSGHIGADALAAVAVGGNALGLLSLIGTGMMMALSPIDEARRAGYTGIALCTGIIVVSAGILIVARHAIADIYTDDRAVIDLAARLLLLAGFFQISDGLQLGCAGALRGYQDARVPLAITAISYWGIGFTLAWVFGIVRGGGAPGVWLGLIAGLTAGVLLALRYRVISTR
jgi:MATE family multidrug resistance protein